MTANRKVVALCTAALLVAAVAVMVVVATPATTDNSAAVGAPHPDVQAVLTDPSLDPATAEQQAQALQAQHNEDQLRHEYAAAAGQLPALPAGAVVDVDARAAKLLATDTADPTAGIPVYEEGYFASWYAMDWQCAWVEEAVSAQEGGDEARMEQAITTFQGFVDSPLAEAFPDFAGVVSDQVATAVRAGGGPALTDFRNNTCAA